MPIREIPVEELKNLIGQEVSVSDWNVITQERINQFADATDDHQWIHIDPERATAESPYGTPIAHGFLSLSLLSMLGWQAHKVVGDFKMGINYGFNRVRFPAPVPVGARIRSKRTLKSVELKGGMIEVMNEVVVEIEGQDKPACVAESLSRMVF